MTTLKALVLLALLAVPELAAAGACQLEIMNPCRRQMLKELTGWEPNSSNGATKSYSLVMSDIPTLMEGFGFTKFWFKAFPSAGNLWLPYQMPAYRIAARQINPQLVPPASGPNEYIWEPIPRLPYSFHALTGYAASPQERAMGGVGTPYIVTNFAEDFYSNDPLYPIGPCTARWMIIRAESMQPGCDPDFCVLWRDGDRGPAEEFDPVAKYALEQMAGEYGIIGFASGWSALANFVIEPWKASLANIFAVIASRLWYFTQDPPDQQDFANYQSNVTAVTVPFIAPTLAELQPGGTSQAVTYINAWGQALASVASIADKIEKTKRRFEAARFMGDTAWMATHKTTMTNDLIALRNAMYLETTRRLQLISKISGQAWQPTIPANATMSFEGAQAVLDRMPAGVGNELESRMMLAELWVNRIPQTGNVPAGQWPSNLLTTPHINAIRGVYNDILRPLCPQGPDCNANLSGEVALQ